MIKCNSGNLIQIAVQAFLFLISYILSNQGNRNASDGIALAQTMEAGMDEVSGMLQKIRTLAVQASNGTNTLDDRKSIGKEIESLATEINRIAMKTTFAGKTILNGQTKEGSIFGSKANGAEGGKAGDEGTISLQVGSNKGDIISFKMQSIMFSTLGINDELIKNDDTKMFKTDKDTGALKVDMTKVDFGNAAAKTYIGNVIDLMDTMISKVDGMRAELGAIQNRLESSIRNQSNVAANEADARSRIRDTDFASETAALTQNQIIQQASQTILSQANQRPTVALSLLGG